MKRFVAPAAALAVLGVLSIVAMGGAAHAANGHELLGALQEEKLLGAPDYGAAARTLAAKPKALARRAAAKVAKPAKVKPAVMRQATISKPVSKASLARAARQQEIKTSAPQPARASRQVQATKAVAPPPARARKRQVQLAAKAPAPQPARGQQLAQAAKSSTRRSPVAAAPAPRPAVLEPPVITAEDKPAPAAPKTEEQTERGFATRVGDESGERVAENAPADRGVGSADERGPDYAERGDEADSPISEADFARLEQAIERGLRRGAFGRRQAQVLYDELDNIAYIHDAFLRAGGLGWREQSVVQARVESLRERIQRASQAENIWRNPYDSR